MTTFNAADYLPQVPFPPANMPSGAAYANATTTSQAVCDEQYTNQVKGYLERGASWIITESIKRASSPNPKSYQPSPFPSPIPQRPIVGWTVNEDTGMASMTFSVAPPDPKIQAPSLPAWQDSTPTAGGPLSGGGTYVPLQDPVAVLGPKLDTALAILEQLLRK